MPVIQPNAVLEFTPCGKYRTWGDTQPFRQREPVQSDRINTGSHLDPQKISAIGARDTEPACQISVEAAVQELRALTQQGVRIAIDDFGIGYSNLSRLGRLPVSALKVDRSLITNIGVRKCDRAIVRAVIAMARELGAGVVAEGVEKDEQLAVLRAIGCSECQGYLIARPLAPNAFIQWALGRGLTRL